MAKCKCQYMRTLCLDITSMFTWDNTCTSYICLKAQEFCNNGGIKRRVICIKYWWSTIKTICFHNITAICVGNYKFYDAGIYKRSRLLILLYGIMTFFNTFREIGFIYWYCKANRITTHYPQLTKMHELKAAGIFL